MAGPAGSRLLLPFFVTASLWWLLSWLLGRLHILPPVPMAGRVQQSLVLGLGSYLLWRFPLGAILLLHLLNSYIYFGRHPFWKYVNADGADFVAAAGENSPPAGQSGFCAGGGAWRFIFRGGTGGPWLTALITDCRFEGLLPIMARGSLTVTVEPAPGLLSISNSPPCNSTSFLAMAKPKPKPCSSCIFRSNCM